MLAVFDGILERHLRSSSKDSLQLRQLASLYEAWGMDTLFEMVLD